MLKYTLWFDARTVTAAKCIFFHSKMIIPSFNGDLVFWANKTKDIKSIHDHRSLRFWAAYEKCIQGGRRLARGFRMMVVLPEGKSSARCRCTSVGEGE